MKFLYFFNHASYELTTYFYLTFSLLHALYYYLGSQIYEFFFQNFNHLSYLKNHRLSFIFVVI